MTLSASIKKGLSKLMDFSGRASREEYLGYSAFLLLVLAALVAGMVLASRLIGARVPYEALAVLLVPLHLAWLSAQVRRLRDAGFSPWWALANLFPVVGALLVLALTLWPGTDHAWNHESETNHGSLSIFSPAASTGWGGMTGAGALAGDQPQGRNWPALVAAALAVLVLVALVFVGSQYIGERLKPTPAPAVPVTVVPPKVSSLVLIDDASGARLYYDKSTASLVAPETISIQLVFDFEQAVEREGVKFRSMKQNEVFHCAEHGSSWSTRFYMSEPMGEGAAVFIEDGKGSLLDMSDSEVGNQRLDAVCRLLPGLAVPAPAAAERN